MLAGMLTFITILLLLAGSVSCNHTAPACTNKSIVQVWIPNLATGKSEFVSLGVIVGDGTMILTVINYEDYNPGDVKVVSSANDEFVATIQAIDSRTGAILLKMGTGKIPVVNTRDAATLKVGEKLTILGQANSSFKLKPTEVLVTDIPPNFSALGFSVILPQSTINGGDYAGAQNQGAVVTDQSGKVLGLESIYTTHLVMRLGGPGYIPPIISIKAALEDLSPETTNQPWANGALLFAANVGSKSGNYNGFVREYVPVATAITPVLGELGQPLAISDLPQNFTSYIDAKQGTYSPDGSLLTTVFPRPVELRDSAGKVLTQAKWVAIQWGREDGKPNRIVYGIVAYVVEGRFEITGDINGLENYVLRMFTDTTPYWQ